MKRKLYCTLVALTLLALSPLSYGVLRVVAAENIYGDIAQVLGGSEVTVVSVLNNPNQDPHLFTSKPSTSKAVADADILIFNGANYDTWFSRLLMVKATTKPVTVIDVSALVGAKLGANPHLWYRLSYISQVAVNVTSTYEQRLPAKRTYFEARLRDFLRLQQQLQANVTKLKAQIHGVTVTATEPVAAYLAMDLDLVVLDQAFQLAVMNDAEPSVQSRAMFEQHLLKHQVQALIYNSQVQDPVTEYMQKLSVQQHIPVIGVTELLPVGQSYSQWYQHILDRFTTALVMPTPIKK